MVARGVEAPPAVGEKWPWIPRSLGTIKHRVGPTSQGFFAGHRPRLSGNGCNPHSTPESGVPMYGGYPCYLVGHTARIGGAAPFSRDQSGRLYRWLDPTTTWLARCRRVSVTAVLLPPPPACGRRLPATHRCGH